MNELTKTPSQSRTETVHLILSGDMNGQGRLFGGRLMAWIDELAGVVARRHCGMDITTAAIDNLSFLAGGYIDDTIVMIGAVTWVGNSSMEVQVDTYVEHMDMSRKLINRAHLVMVALDKNEKPARVPRLVPETEEECRIFDEAMKRRLRKN